MIRIGIITFWGVPNYGTFLQAYSLYKYLNSTDNEYDVEVIPYINNKHFNTYYGLIKKHFRYPLINPKTYKELFKGICEFRNTKILRNLFVSYYSKLSHSSRINPFKLLRRKYDILILGSDIIWDYSISFFNHDKYLFGLNIDANKKIAYAASFGTVPISDNNPRYVVDGLKNMDFISVRDEKSQIITKNIVNHDVPIVLDPTFLWDFYNDTNVDYINNYGTYILVYGSFFDKSLTSDIVEYAKENKFKIICIDSLDDSFDWCDITLDQTNISPFEWLSLFKNAKFVVTCTYHGLIFSIIYNKVIIFSPTDFILAKAESFIKYLGLENVLINYKSFSEKLKWNWDYKLINQKINLLKKNSIAFLNNALNS